MESNCKYKKIEKVYISFKKNNPGRLIYHESVQLLHNFFLLNVNVISGETLY